MYAAKMTAFALSTHPSPGQSSSELNPPESNNAVPRAQHALNS